MDFEIPEELRLMVDTVRRFRLDELEPISLQVDKEDRIPEHIVDRMRELGLFGLSLPEKYGGLELGALGEALVQEELSKANACFRSRIASTNGIGSQGIVMHGTEKQKQKYLPRFASGEFTGCFGLTEPDAGSDAQALRTRAVRKGDHWVLNGTKQFITNGDVADVATIIAVTDPEKRARGGMTSFIVERDFEGFSVGKVDESMGLRGNHTAQLIMEDCIVPADNVVGGDDMIGKGFTVAMQIMDKARIIISSHALGGAQRCLDLSVEYAKQRETFGKPIGQHQLVAAMLAEMATDIFAARQMLYYTCWLRDTMGQKVVKEASMVKLFCTEMANRVAYKAGQIHGGYGWMKEYAVERFYRDLRLLTLFEGTSEIQKLIIARELMKN
jgi:acyl-CoA dehydrogenase